MTDFPNKVKVLEKKWKHRLKKLIYRLSHTLVPHQKAIMCTIEFLYFENISKKVII